MIGGRRGRNRRRGRRKGRGRGRRSRGKGGEGGAGKTGEEETEEGGMKIKPKGDRVIMISKEEEGRNNAEEDTREEEREPYVRAFTSVCQCQFPECHTNTCSWRERGGGGGGCKAGQRAR